MGRVRRDVRERFWVKVNKDGPTPEHRPDLGPCWLWTAAAAPDGYGRFHFGSGDVAALAHRVAIELTVGPIPARRQVDHLCRTPLCVRPDHLEPVPARVNRARQAAASAQKDRSCVVCGRIHYARGLCNPHYQQWLKAGKPDPTVWVTLAA